MTRETLRIRTAHPDPARANPTPGRGRHWASGLPGRALAVLAPAVMALAVMTVVVMAVVALAVVDWATTLPAFAQDSPFDEILGTTSEEEEMLAPVELASVTASDGVLNVTVFMGAAFAQQEGTVRIIAVNSSHEEAFVHAVLVLSRGQDYYPQMTGRTERVAPGAETRLEIPYSLAALTETTRARLVVARSLYQKPDYPPDGAFLSVVVDARRDATPTVWKPIIARRGNLAFHYPADLFTAEEFEARAAAYAAARARVDAFWEESGEDVIPVYFFATHEDKAAFLLSDDEERAYPQVVMDYAVEGRRRPPGELLSWLRSVLMGNPPTLFHDAVALVVQEEPRWKDQPLDDWLRARRQAREFLSLDALLRYDGASPEDATRTIGIPQLASLVEYLRTIRDPGAFNKTFLHMQRGASDTWRDHNADTLRGFYDLDLESLEKEWLHWLDTRLARKPE